jgi:hypothetical protein
MISKESQWRRSVFIYFDNKILRTEAKTMQIRILTSIRRPTPAVVVGWIHAASAMPNRIPSAPGRLCCFNNSNIVLLLHREQG